MPGLLPPLILQVWHIHYKLHACRLWSVSTRCCQFVKNFSVVKSKCYCINEKTKFCDGIQLFWHIFWLTELEAVSNVHPPYFLISADNWLY
jgi:hypothetical protein